MSDYAKIQSVNYEELYDKYKQAGAASLGASSSAGVDAGTSYATSPSVDQSNIFTKGFDPSETGVTGVSGVNTNQGISSTQRVNPYVENQDLFASLEEIGTGEHSPAQYNEYTGKKLDFWS